MPYAAAAGLLTDVLPIAFGAKRTTVRKYALHVAERAEAELGADRQQMQWTEPGIHLLLQTRTRTLDGTLRPLFEGWYPGLSNDTGNEAAQATA